MNFIKQNSGVVAVIALIIAIIGIYTPVGKSVSNLIGGVTNYDEVDATAMKIGGSSGSRIGPIIEGSCTAIAGTANATVVASTTTIFDCAVTGVVSGDTVFASFATTTLSSPLWGATSSQWDIVHAAASTTSGFITLTAFNMTGGTASLSASGIASTTSYRISHPVSTVPGL